jgi:hypothetical protein
MAATAGLRCVVRITNAFGALFVVLAQCSASFLLALVASNGFSLFSLWDLLPFSCYTPRIKQAAEQGRRESSTSRIKHVSNRTTLLIRHSLLASQLAIDDVEVPVGCLAHVRACKKAAQVTLEFDAWLQTFPLHDRLQKIPVRHLGLQLCLHHVLQLGSDICGHDMPLSRVCHASHNNERRVAASNLQE